MFVRDAVASCLALVYDGIPATAAAAVHGGRRTGEPRAARPTRRSQVGDRSAQTTAADGAALPAVKIKRRTKAPRPAPPNSGWLSSRPPFTNGHRQAGSYVDTCT